MKTPEDEAHWMMRSAIDVQSACKHGSICRGMVAAIAARDAEWSARVEVLRGALAREAATGTANGKVICCACGDAVDWCDQAPKKCNGARARRAIAADDRAAAPAVEQPKPTREDLAEGFKATICTDPKCAHNMAGIKHSHGFWAQTGAAPSTGGAPAEPSCMCRDGDNAFIVGHRTGCPRYPDPPTASARRAR